MQRYFRSKDKYIFANLQFYAQEIVHIAMLFSSI